MCGRVVADLTSEQWTLLGVPVPSVPARYNATRSTTLALVTGLRGERHVTPARWGLVPPNMTRTEADRLALFNARIETVRSKPAFRDAWKHRRSLLPISGWIEWRPAAQGGRKQPHLVRRRDGKPVVLAALHTPHEDTLTFAVITGPAAPALSWLHDRQPLALASGDWDAWLSNEERAFHPLPARVYEVVPLDPAINDARLDHPGVVQVIGDPVRGAA